MSDNCQSRNGNLATPWLVKTKRMKSGNYTRRAIKGALAGSAVLLAISIPNAASAQTQDAPSFCTLDGKKTWYFALGKMVFRIPVSKNLSPNIMPQPPGGDWLIPPDASAPVGCKNNPQQIAIVSLINWPPLQLPRDAPDLPDRVYTLDLDFVRLTNQVSGTTEAKPCGVAVKNYLKILDDGTIYCTNKQEGLDTLSGSWDLPWKPYSMYWRFFVAKKVYETPLGGQLSVFGSPFGGFSASYYLAPKIVIHYQWLMPLHEIAVDPAYVIKADELIEKSLKRYEIVNYPWQDRDTIAVPHPIGQ